MKKQITLIKEIIKLQDKMLKAKYKDIRQAYERPSYNKIRIFDKLVRYWKNYCNDVNGDFLSVYVISNNTHIFTVAFFFKTNNTSYYIYETPSYTYKYMIDNKTKYVTCDFKNRK